MPRPYQVHARAQIAQRWQQLTVTAEDCRLELERSAVGVRKERQQVVFGSAALERRDQVQDADRSSRGRRLGRFC